MSDASPDDASPNEAGPDADEVPARYLRKRRRGAPTWAKLWTAVVTANVAGLVVATWVSRLVRNVPDSASTETALLFGYYAAMAVVTFVDALLVDELVFKGAFRKTHLQGLGGRRLGKRDEDVEEAAVTMQRSTVSFPFLLLCCGVLTYLFFNVINRDFDGYYRSIGKHLSALHQGDDMQKVAAVQELAIRRHPRVLPALFAQLEEGGEAGRWSAWALGRFTDLPSRRPLYEPLVAASRSADPLLRREALIALGRIQHRPMAEAIQQEIQAVLDAGEPLDHRLLYALGSIQVMTSVPVLEDLLHRGDETTQRIAAWTLAQHRDQRGGRAVVEILEQRLPTSPHEVRCAIVHSLGILSDEESNLALIDMYEQVPSAQRSQVCERYSLSLRPDGDGSDRIDLFMPQESFDMKLIRTMGQMRATSPEVRAKVEPWLRDFIAAESTTAAAREAAVSLLRGIEEGRDDSTAKSVDEALGLQ